jgi:uncharacterized membrane protein YphA (DoxX/SURF4 family)
MRKVVLTVARIGLAAVFLWAAYVKLREPWQLFAMSIDTLNLLPEPAVLFLARVLPWTELVLGVVLLTGIKLRWSAVFATGLLLAFFGVMLRTYLAGIEAGCGCFGPGETLGPATLARDAALLAVSAWLTWEGFRPKLLHHQLEVDHQH